MTDYIKREDAIKAVANNYWHGTDCECYAFAHKALDGIKSADVAPVVRCKDCIYYQDNNNGYPHNECRWRSDETPDATDFCSFGERKDDE